MRILPLADGGGLLMPVLGADAPGYHYEGAFWSAGQSAFDTLLIRLAP